MHTSYSLKIIRSWKNGLMNILEEEEDADQEWTIK